MMRFRTLFIACTVAAASVPLAGPTNKASAQDALNTQNPRGPHVERDDGTTTTTYHYVPGRTGALGTGSVSRKKRV